MEMAILSYVWGTARGCLRPGYAPTTGQPPEELPSRGQAAASWGRALPALAQAGSLFTCKYSKLRCVRASPGRPWAQVLQGCDQWGQYFESGCLDIKPRTRTLILSGDVSREQLLWGQVRRKRGKQIGEAMGPPPETLTFPPGSLCFNICSWICPVPVLSHQVVLCSSPCYMLRRDCQTCKNFASQLLSYWWFEINHSGSVLHHGNLKMLQIRVVLYFSFQRAGFPAQHHHWSDGSEHPSTKLCNTCSRIVAHGPCLSF